MPHGDACGSTPEATVPGKVAIVGACAPTCCHLPAPWRALWCLLRLDLPADADAADGPELAQ